MTSERIANRVAGAFFCAWLAIALAAGDHPPPPEFLLLAGLLLACALLVRLRVPTYLRWQREQACGRISRVIRDNRRTSALDAVEGPLGVEARPTAGRVERQLTVLDSIGRCNTPGTA